MLKQFQKVLLIIVSVYILFSTISLVTLNPHIDERESHLPTVELFYNNDIISAITSQDYKSASTPLPYIIVSTPLKILNITPALFTARVFNILVSLITLFIFIQLCDGKKNNLIIPALILVFYPYFLKPSFAFFMSIYGLMFFLLFIYVIKRKNGFNIFFAGLSLASAVLCQQFYLIVFVFYYGYWLYEEYFTELGTKSISNLFYFLLPFIIPLIVFVLWGGLTHRNYKSWGSGFSFVNLTGVFVILGSALFPFIIFSIKEFKRYQIIILMFISGLLVLFAFPVWVNQPTEGGISGLTFNFLSKVNDSSNVASFVLKTVLCYMGISSFFIFIKKADTGNSRLLLLLFFALAIGFSFNKLPSERHMLPLIATAFLFIFNQVNRQFIFKYWLTYSVIIGSIYFYYIMFAYKM